MACSLPYKAKNNDLTIQHICCKLWVGLNMLFNLVFYEDRRGFKPVEEYIENQPAKEQDKIFADLDLLEEGGYRLRRPTADYIGNKLYELRPGRHRVLYCFYQRINVLILHALLKKTDQLPKKDILVAQKRKTEFEQRIEKGEIQI